MFGLSSAFVEAMKYSHVSSVLVEVYEGIGGDLLYSTDDLDITSGLLDGEVSVGDQAIRRRVNLKLVDPVTNSGSNPLTSVTTSEGADVLYDDPIAYDDPVMYNGLVTQTIVF